METVCDNMNRVLIVTVFREQQAQVMTEEREGGLNCRQITTIGALKSTQLQALF